MLHNDQKTENNEPSTDELPKWLNESYFIDILEKKFHQHYKIINMKTKLATAKGENFVSIMYRTNLDIQLADSVKIINLSFIIKALPDIGITEEIIKDFNVFPKEIEMYSKIIPGFEALLHKVGDDITFGPKCVKTTFKDPTTIVLKDLSKLKYCTAIRQKGLDMDHTKLVLKKLAKFHAASMVFYDKVTWQKLPRVNGPYSPCFEHGMFSKANRATFEKFHEANFKLFLKIMEDWTIGRNFTKMMNLEKSRIFEETDRVVNANSNNLNVLNHGDMWANNSMFFYDETTGLVKDILLIDFQMCFWASPAIDLNYFIITSVNEKIKLHKFDYLIQFYHHHLSETLKQLNYLQNIPTLREIHIEMLDKGYYALISTISVLPICLLDQDDDANIENLMKDDEKANAFKRRLYNNPRYVRQMEFLLPYFEKKGILLNEDFYGN